jgi:predicted DNA-binding protein (MmcQ/YjbR family)
MSIEKDLFLRSHVDFSQLETYGFIKKGKSYSYQKEIFNNSFLADIHIDSLGNVFGKVIDLSTQEEYVALNISSFQGEFVNRVRDSYRNLLIDIKRNCFITDYFVFDQANRICHYILNQYGDEPEFLWEDHQDGVFRNKKNLKWYGIIMNIDYSKIDKKDGKVEVMNVKLDSSLIEKLIYKKGFYPAYHMKSTYWITIVLDNTLKDEDIIPYIDMSYQIICQKK